MRQKKTVQINDDKVKLEIGNDRVDYQIINKHASNKDSQLNAMAIAPIVDGKPYFYSTLIRYA